MFRVRSEVITWITVIACAIVMIANSLSESIDVGYVAICVVLTGILIMLGMIYEELKL